MQALRQRFNDAVISSHYTRPVKKESILKVCFLFVMSLLAYAGAAFASESESARGDRPIPASEWQIVRPSDANVQAQSVTRLLDLAFNDGATQAAVLIVGGRLVGERYAQGYDAQSFGTSWSVAKSFYAALIGIAIDRGEIGSLDDKVSTYIDVFNDRRANISLRHLLDMTSGLAFPEHEHETMFFRDDHLAYALEVGVEKPAGEVFEYNNVNSMLLSEVLHRATGIPADQLLAERILTKIGIQRYTLWRDAAGNPMTYCCIDMSARDYARFGLLFARSGRWGDQQIISQEFVDTTFSEAWSDIPSSTIEHARGYGMHWWVSKNDQQASIFNASGKFGQYVFVDRANDVVFTRITRYASTGASVQDWGAMQALTWISNVTLLRKAGEFLTLIGLLDPVADIATPITYESGVSNEFFSDYSTIIDALVDVSQPVIIGAVKTAGDATATK